jgi:rifamycin polyketide synthase module 1/2/3
MAKLDELTHALRTAAKEIERLRKRNRELQDGASEPIAIVAQACRFPGGVDSPEQLWELLAAGRDATSGFPEDRGWPRDLHDPDPSVLGKSLTQRGGFLHEAAAFDPEPFGISPREALSIDPQQRLLLEVAWELFERAELPIPSLRGSATGVFVGLMYQDYGSRLFSRLDALDGHIGLGSSPSIASGRIAYTFGLEGPALTLDTACSSSLVALHLACDSLRRRECRLALAGGATIMSTPAAFVEFSRQRGLSPDGRCKPFSAAADGVAWGEGVGMLLLERLSDARHNGHPILALVRGSAVNQDGRSQGLTAPNGPAQRQVIAAALTAAGLAADDIDVIEAHGTGTRLGDPIEAHALRQVYIETLRRDRPLWLGSIKSNLAHTQAAAGAASIIKMVLAMRHARLPATLHIDNPSPHIDWANGLLSPLVEARPWPRTDERPRRAGVSSFGISGTNAHVLLEQAPDPEPTPRRDGPSRLVLVDGSSGSNESPNRLPLLLSAHSPAALAGQARKLGERLAAATSPPELFDLGYSLASKRAAFEHRAAVVLGPGRPGAAKLLAELASGRLGDAMQLDRATKQPKLALLFTGQGAQRGGMGKSLHAAFPRFRGRLDEVCAEFGPLLDRPLRDLMFADRGSRESALLDRTQYTQPALFAYELALCELLSSFGVAPDLLLGHSIGELSAATVAGVWSLADACKLVAARGRLMQALPGGCMVSVQAGPDELAELLASCDEVDLAGLNGPRATVVSGPREAIADFTERFEATFGPARRAQPLAVSHAFHSRMMQPMLDAFAEVLTSVELHAPRVPIVCNLDGELGEPTQMSSPSYWLEQIRAPVRFAPAVETLAREQVRVVLEVGPDRILATMVPACLPPGEAERVRSIACSRRDQDELETFVDALAALHCRGVRVDWNEFFEPHTPRAVDLPTYAFDRQRYWLDAPAEANPSALGLELDEHPLLGAAVPLADEGGCVFTGTLSLAAHAWLGDHVVFDRVLVPATALLDMALHVGAHVGSERVEELNLDAPLGLDPDQARALQLRVGAEDEHGRRRCTMHSRPAEAPDAPWQLHASGTLVRGSSGSSDAQAITRLEGGEPVDIEAMHERLAALGLAYGPSFRGIERAWQRGDEQLVELRLPDELLEGADKHVLHPALLDAALHLAAFAGARARPDEVALPILWTGVSVHATGAVRARAHLRPGTRPNSVSVTLSELGGRVIATIDGLTTRSVSASRLSGTLARGSQRGGGLYRVDWQPLEPKEGSAKQAPQNAVLLGGPPALALRLGLQRIESIEHADGGLLLVPMLASDESLDGVCLRALELLRAWLAIELDERPELVVLTCGALALDGDDAPPKPALAAVWGLVRSLMREQPEQRVRLVEFTDFEQPTPPACFALLDALTTHEPELVVRAGVARAPQLVAVPSRPLQSDSASRASSLAQGTVLITGATCGLARELATHLVENHGVRHLTLCSRRGPEAEGAAEFVAGLERAGAEVWLYACDVADRHALAEVIDSITDDAPLRAVIHTAGALDDHLFNDLDAASFAAVFGPKLQAAVWLDELTRELELDAFVLVSSIAGVFGARGQANYAAANAGLHALCSQRRRRGLPGLVLAYGPWAEVGMAARLSAADRARLARAGTPPLSIRDALALFDAALSGPESDLLAMHLDTRALARSSAPAPPLLDAFVPRRPHSSHEPTSGRGLIDQLRALEPALAEQHVRALVRNELAKTLGLSNTRELSDERALQELGLDSLMAVELRDRLVRVSGLQLAATLVFDYPTIATLAAFLCQRLLSASVPMPAPRRAVAPAPDRDAIAIVSLACRFPGGVERPEDLWTLLADGRDAIGPFPRDRGWQLDDLYDPDPTHVGKVNARGGGFLDAPADFDPAFFGISPREAMAMDPQQRLLLELAWEAIERARIVPASLQGTRTGVYVGVCYDDYQLLAPPAELAEDGFAALGVAHSVASGRIAYSLGLEGPTLTVDTACSSSLVALHLGAAALRAGECELALVGSATVFATTAPFLFFSRMQALSPDGRCKPFAATADGAGWAEGAAMIVLERLSDARRNGHPVLALVRGSAINQDGRSQGLTAPNGPAQRKVITAALASAALEPGDIDLVEAHGTGTALGDPIEAQALQDAYDPGRTRPLWLGSIKSNLGHTQAAAGLAGLLKVVLALEHERIPETLHADSPTPHVDWGRTSLRLVDAAQPWPRGPAPRRAAISAFGISGTNAHVILEEGDHREPRRLPTDAAPRTTVPLLLSGKTPAALRSQAARLAAVVDQHPLADLGVSLATTRTHHELRAWVVADHPEAARSRLEALQRDDGAELLRASPHPGLALLFTGQGAQYPGMGRELFGTHGVFASALAAACTRFDAELETPLLPVMFGEHADAARLIDRTDFTQPALFALELALFRLYESFGIRPQALLGHSIGELVAAHVAGVFSLDDACRLVAARGRAMQALPAGGAMYAIEADEPELRIALAEHEHTLDIAAVNGLRATVISGDDASARAFAAQFEARGRKTKRLRVSHAFHSARMQPMLDEFRALVAELELAAPRIPILSNVDGQVLDAARASSPDYWATQLRREVRFLDGVRSLRATGIELALELGPHPTLGAMLPGCHAAADSDEPLVGIASLRRDRNPREAMVASLAELHGHGLDIDWPAFFAPLDAEIVELPTYAFGRRRFWYPPRSPDPALAAAPAPLPAPAELELAAQLRMLELEPRRQRLIELVRRHTAAVLGLTDAGEVDLDLGFADMGFDSVMAVELRTRLQRALELDLAATLMFDHPSPRRVAAMLTELLGPIPVAAEAPARPTTPPPHADAERVAIIGIGLRLPGGVIDLGSLWALLDAERDAISAVPADRWPTDGFYDPTLGAPGKSYVAEGGFLDEVDRFDATLFNISPNEADSLDPQQRLLLETAWEAFERAEIIPATLDGTRTGVFVGIGTSEYGLSNRGPSGPYSVTGSHSSFGAGRLAYSFALRGPALSVDTACSSSLVALHLGTRALLAGECELALVGGVQVMSAPEAFVQMCQLRALAPDGRCKTFSDRADGYGRGEGCVVLIIERLSDALAHGRTPLAIVRGTAINHDGPSSGITAPSGPAQQQVLEAALAHAGLSPDAIDYVECHGTGTSLGDPIEVQSLASVYGRGRAPDRPLLLGAIKPNIGHLEAASGLASVAKVLALLEHDTLPPTLHTHPRNHHIDWQRLPVAVVDRPSAWPEHAGARRIGVSSFGLSGTNAHVILERAHAASADPQPGDPSQPVALLFSSADEPGLRRWAARLHAHLDTHTDLSTFDLAAGMALTRSHLRHRAAIVARSRPEALLALARFAAGQSVAHAVSAIARVEGRVVFVCPGQGSQWIGMARELLAESPRFAAMIDACARALEPHVDWSLRTTLEGGPEAASLERVDVVQPVLWAMMVALADLWRSLGVEPDAVIGHSQGEIAAATIAGALTLEDAAKIVALRSRVLTTLSGRGAMALCAVERSELETRLERFAGHLSLAVDNGPGSLVVSGQAAAVEELVAELELAGRFARRINVDYASHCAQIDEVREPLLAALAGITPRAPSIAMFSTVDPETPIGPHSLDADYWYRNLRHTVRFAGACERLLASGHRFFIELGPHPVLATAIDELLGRAGVRGVVLPSLRRDQGSLAQLLTSVGGLHCHGHRVDWSAQLGARRRGLALPTYPFASVRHWLPLRHSTDRLDRRSASGFDHARRDSPSPTAEWEFAIPAGPASPWATAIELARIAADMPLPIELRELELDPTLLHDRADGDDVRVFVHPPTGHGQVEAFCRTSEGWRRFFHARLAAPANDDEPASELAHAAPTPLGELAFVSLPEGGYALAQHGNVSRARLLRPTPLAFEAQVLHGAALDVIARVLLGDPLCSYEILGCACVRLQQNPSALTLEIQLGRVEVLAPGQVRANVRVRDPDGPLLFALDGLHLRRGPEITVARPAAASLEPRLAALAARTFGIPLADDDDIAAHPSIDSLALVSFLATIEAEYGLDLLARVRARTQRFTLAAVAGWIRDGEKLEQIEAPPPEPDLTTLPLPEAGARELVPASADGSALARVVWRFEGTALEVAVRGRGQPLVLLPPLGCELQVWSPLLAALAPTWSVLAPNYPGYGRSQTPKLPDLRELLSGLAWLLELEAGGPATVIGWSFGGLLAQLLALARPDLVARIGLLHVAGIADHTSIGLASLLDRVDVELARELSSHGHPGALARLFESADKATLLHYAALLPDAAARARGLVLTQPSLVIAGAHDSLATPAAARTLAASWPDTHVEVLADAGHFAPLVAPTAIASALERWLG